MKLLIDMNLSPQWVSFLAESGFESVHWSTIGEPTAADAQIMDYASANGLIVFTHDLDFGALLANRKTRRPSVVQVRTQDVLPVAIGGVVVRALHATRAQLEEAALVTVDPNGTGSGFFPFSRPRLAVKVMRSQWPENGVIGM